MLPHAVLVGFGVHLGVQCHEGVELQTVFGFGEVDVSQAVVRSDLHRVLFGADGVPEGVFCVLAGGLGGGCQGDGKQAQEEDGGRLKCGQQVAEYAYVVNVPHGEDE